MVPVISQKGVALFPTKERRARRLLERGDAKPYWQKGIFCIRLVRAETENRQIYPSLAVGLDSGSKREAYTALTPKGVILNITTNTPNWVKNNIETRRNLRRSRRFRKTPYRKCRGNRSGLRNANRVPPSTKSRWDAKLRILKVLFKILPITHLNVEDIQAVSKKGKKKWNVSFSSLQIGKDYFYEKIIQLYPGVKLSKTQGIDTKNHRDARSFKKSKSKLDYKWESHNVDSHSLAEMALQANVKPYKGLYKLEFMQFHRRQLHVQNFTKGGIRKPYGRTHSAGMGRGSVLVDLKTNNLCYLGGESKMNCVAIHSLVDGKRINQFKKLKEVKMLYNNKWRVQFLPCLSAKALRGRGFLAQER